MNFSGLICSKNGKKSRKQGILECFTLYDGSCASITLLLSSLMKVLCILIKEDKDFVMDEASEDQHFLRPSLSL